MMANMHDRADSYEVLGAEVRRRRLDLALRQDELAALAGVSTRFVHTLEQGKPTVRLDKVLAVLEQVGLDLTLEPGAGTIRIRKD
jgi:HTH-type transcriptional regulator/antitoxin HipB